MGVCLNATVIFLIQTQSVHTEKSPRNLETEIDIKEKGKVDFILSVWTYWDQQSAT